MPDVPTAVLLLGDRSPYGLSVARALMASRVPIRRVVVPTEDGWRRTAARRGGTGGPGGAAALLRRALTKTRRMMTSPDPRLRELEMTGEPIHPLVLDPGITAERLERSCGDTGVAWDRVGGVRDAAFARGLGRDRPAWILSAAFPFILPPGLLDVPAEGTINFHPSLLPRCRGCHPIYWTLASGETQGGVTAHHMTREVDAGNIVAQIPLPLSEHDDYATLYRRAMDASAELVRAVERFVLDGGGPGIPQDHSRATRFHEDTEEDHRVRWAHQSPREIVALARTGEAFVTAHGERLGILRTAEHHTISRERRSAPPGEVIALNDEALVVAASGGAVDIRSLAWRGRRHVAGGLAVRLGIRRGERLE